MGPKGAVKKEEVKAPVKVAVVKKEGAGEGGNVMDNLTQKQAFKKFSYRGEDINKLLSLNMDELA
jgi:hypothetical protein